MGNQIDFVIPWVDSTDEQWGEEKQRYSELEGKNIATDSSNTRYRDWDTLKYLFRGIEEYSPWVRYVFLITCGHLPKWINVNCSKLRIINHKDFIPHEYLPTFSSHAIELNIHRIPDLSENFVYFNDDILILRKLNECDFFRNGLPCDYAIMNPINCATRLSVQDIALTAIEVINDNFCKNVQIRKNKMKWFSFHYGKYMFRTLCLVPWPHFVGFLGKHQCNPFLKSTFYEVWEKEYDLLDSTCRHKFRTRRDVNQWLMRYWQLASGKFRPIHPYGEMYTIKNDNIALFDAILNSREKTICVNDGKIEEIMDFDKTKEELLSILNQRYPNESIFEKKGWTK